MLSEICTVPETEKKPRGRPAGELTAFGRWLKTSEEWSKTTLAKESGLSPSHVQSLCNGTKAPSRTVALAIAKVTNDEFGMDSWGVPFEE